MSLCPVCGRGMCDHTPAERGQTFEEMMRPLNDEEVVAFENNPTYSDEKIRVAQKHRHYPVEK